MFARRNSPEDHERMAPPHVNDTLRQGFAYRMGRLRLRLSYTENRTYPEIDQLDAPYIRKRGKRLIRRSLGTTALCGLALLGGCMLWPDDKPSPIRVIKPDETCELSNDTTVITRQSGESDMQLAITRVTGGDYGHGQKETNDWVKTHNTGLKEWPGEQVTIPQRYDCRPKG